MGLMRTVTLKNPAYLAIVDWLWADTLMEPSQPQFWAPGCPWGEQNLVKQKSHNSPLGFLKTGSEVECTL